MIRPIKFANLFRQYFEISKAIGNVTNCNICHRHIKQGNDPGGRGSGGKGKAPTCLPIIINI